MSQSQSTKNTTANAASDDGRSEDLRDSPMMAHLLDALEAGTDIGHYGRLTFVMIARHFLEDDKIVDLLGHQPDQNVEDARALVLQVKVRDYNPPKRNASSNGRLNRIFRSAPLQMNPVPVTSTRNFASPKHLREHQRVLGGAGRGQQ